MAKGEWKPALPNSRLVAQVHREMQPPGVPCECRDCLADRVSRMRSWSKDTRPAYRKRLIRASLQDRQPGSESSQSG